MKPIKTGLLLACVAILILSLTLTGCSSSGSQGNQIVLYPGTKILTDEEAANIIDVTNNMSTILFTSTAFSTGIKVGNVLACNESVPGAEYGFLDRVTGVSNQGGTVDVQVEPATLEDAIEQGTIVVNQTIPMQNLMSSAVWATGVEVAQVAGGWSFNESPVEGVTITGYVLPYSLAHVYAKPVFDHGLQEFDFIFSPGLQMEANLTVEAGVSWDKEYTVAEIPGLSIDIWGPVIITPEIGLVVGTDGQITGTFEAGVTYDRSYDVGIKYYHGSWSRINEVHGEGASLEPPSFSGHAEARVYAGPVLSGRASVAYVAGATLGATVLGNVQASGEIESSPWQWQYDLQLYLSAQVFAELDLLRIAKIRWNGPTWQYPDPPYDLAYGVSGRVTTGSGNGLSGVQINFSGGQSSVTTDADGYWCKHLLKGEVIATPEKSGYVFDPPSMTITGSASDIDFQASETQQPPSGWNIEVVDSLGDVGRDSSLAFGADGSPSISYYDASNGDLKYAHENGSTWQIQTVDSAGDVGQASSLAFDPAGNPAIVYCDSTDYYLKYAHWSGGSWHIETVDSCYRETTKNSLVFDSTGMPTIAYYDASYDLMYARFDGTTWNKQVVYRDGLGPGWTRSTSLINTANITAIAFREPYVGLRYARWNGAAWEIETVDSGYGTGAEVSMKLDAAGNPAAAYWWQGAFEGPSSLKYASFNGTSWVMDDLVALGNTTRDQQPSLAFDTSGNPNISYYNLQSGELEYASWDGSRWNVEAVDTSGDAYRGNSLAFDSGGHPAISYYDATNGDLKFASLGAL